MADTKASVMVTIWTGTAQPNDQQHTATVQADLDTIDDLARELLERQLKRLELDTEQTTLDATGFEDDLRRAIVG